MSWPALVLLDFDNTLHDQRGASSRALAAFAAHVAKATGAAAEKLMARYAELCSLYPASQFTNGLAMRHARLSALLAPWPTYNLDAALLELGRLLLRETTWLPGAREALQRFAQSGRRIVIVTAGFRDTQRDVLTALSPSFAPLDVVYALGEEYTKPDGSAWGEALRRGGVEPEEAVAIGDHFEVDVLGAAQAGVPQIWIQPEGPSRIEEPPLFLGIAADLLDASRILRASSWPLPAGSRPFPKTSAGAVHPATTSASAFSLAYEEEIVCAAPSAAVRESVEGGRVRLEQAFSHAANEVGFSRAYTVERILTIGSVARDTYTLHPPDFDILVYTNESADQIEPAHIELLTRAVERELAGDASLARLLEAPDSSAAIEFRTPERHGATYFLARGHGRAVPQGEGQGRHLVDLNVGRPQRAFAYEQSMARWLASLGDSARARMRSEIRLAKRVLSAGTRVRHLPDVPGIVTEQLVLQFGAVEEPNGSCAWLKALLRLLRLARSFGGQMPTFSTFRAQFPLPRPLGLEGSRSLESQDLWSLIDGAEQQKTWSMLLELALRFERLTLVGGRWNVEGVVAVG